MAVFAGRCGLRVLLGALEDAGGSPDHSFDAALDGGRAPGRGRSVQSVVGQEVPEFVAGDLEVWHLADDVVAEGREDSLGGVIDIRGLDEGLGRSTEPSVT